MSGSDYIILDFNRVSLELEGKTRAEVVGKSLHDLRPNIDEYGLIPVFRSVWKTGEPGYFPSKVYVDDVFANYYENRVFRLSEDRIVAVYDDVTERMRTEESLRQRESLLREVLDGVDHAIAIYEPVDQGDDFRFVSVNKGAEALMHYSADEVIGRRVTELFPGEASVGLITNMRHALVTGETVNIPLKQYTDDRITQWVENTILRLPSGKVMAMFRDTFAERMAERALKESEAALVEAQAIAKTGSWTYDIATDRAHWSGEMFRIFDIDPAHGEPSWEEHRRRIHPDDWERMDAGVAGAIADGTTYRERFRIVRGDGELLTAETIGRAVRDEAGTIVRLSGTVRDVSDQVREEEERLRLQAQVAHAQRLESIGTLASGVAHEINNPISIVMNYAQFIIDEAGDAEAAKEYAAAIVDGSERIANIVRNLLDFSRQDNAEVGRVEIDKMIDNTLAMIRSSFLKDQIKIVREFTAGLPPVRCRGQQIQQVLMNLLTNARDAVNKRFMESPSDKTIRVTATPFSRDDRSWVRVTVEDNGGGIPADIADHVFDPFMTTKPKGVGTGLGLSISYGLVRDHGGSLGFETDEGVGTQFYIELLVGDARG